MIDLTPFCATRFDHREHLRAPFRHGTWVYATNAHLAVRVPSTSRPDVIAILGPGNIGDLFAKAFEREGEFLLMPPLPPMPVACEVCGGSGHVDWDDDEACFECGGTGITRVAQRLGDSAYSLHYLHLLAALPQVRIRTDGIGPRHAAALIFDGGEAILMPCREK